MDTITYLLLSEENFSETALDDFLRHQEVKECWRKNISNAYVLVACEYVEDWDIPRRREIAWEIQNVITGEGFAYGAFHEGMVVGYIAVSNAFFGSRHQYAQLLLFHVSEPYRRRGIGKELFSLACKAAKETGAEKLYISAHPSRESQAAYRKLGCTEAAEVNPLIAENEPYDVQMEFAL